MRRFAKAAAALFVGTVFEQVLAGLRPDLVLYLVGVNEIDRDDLNEFDSKLDPPNESLLGAERVAQIVAAELRPLLPPASEQ